MEFVDKQTLVSIVCVVVAYLKKKQHVCIKNVIADKVYTKTIQYDCITQSCKVRLTYLMNC